MKNKNKRKPGRAASTMETASYSASPLVTDAEERKSACERRMPLSLLPQFQSHLGSGIGNANTGTTAFSLIPQHQRTQSGVAFTAQHNLDIRIIKGEQNHKKVLNQQEIFNRQFRDVKRTNKILSKIFNLVQKQDTQSPNESQISTLNSGLAVIFGFK